MSDSLERRIVASIRGWYVLDPVHPSEAVETPALERIISEQLREVRDAARLLRAVAADDHPWEPVHAHASALL